MITTYLISNIIILFAGVNLYAASFDQSHAGIDRILRNHVKDGLVDYKTIKANPSALNEYMASLLVVGESEFDSWINTEKLAYLINIYNAATIKLIVDNYPVKSISDINKEGQGPWKLETVDLFGKKISLDYLEHEIIRKNFNDPRVHFALVCAAKGCPKLPSSAFIPQTLDEQLTARTKLYLADKSINHIDQNSKTIFLSSIFSWFADDFIRANDSVLDFVKLYIPEDEAGKIDGNYNIKFTEYDWSLNDGSG